MLTKSNQNNHKIFCLVRALTLLSPENFADRQLFKGEANCLHNTVVLSNTKFDKSRICSYIMRFSKCLWSWKSLHKLFNMLCMMKSCTCNRHTHLHTFLHFIYITKMHIRICATCKNTHANIRTQCICVHIYSLSYCISFHKLFKSFHHYHRNNILWFQENLMWTIITYVPSSLTYFLFRVRQQYPASCHFGSSFLLWCSHHT